MAFLDRTARSMLLGELVAGLGLTLRYFEAAADAGHQFCQRAQGVFERFDG